MASLSPCRNSSTTSGVAEASQTAADLIARRVEVEFVRSGDPGNLSAESVNSLPFAHQDAERVPQFPRRLRGQFRSPRFAIHGTPGRLSQLKRDLGELFFRL